jgi:hypothetical protein
MAQHRGLRRALVNKVMKFLYVYDLHAMYVGASKFMVMKVQVPTGRGISSLTGRLCSMELGHLSAPSEARIMQTCGLIFWLARHRAPSVRSPLTPT